jgi:hypothetical protein
MKIYSFSDTYLVCVPKLNKKSDVSCWACQNANSTILSALLTSKYVFFIIIMSFFSVSRALGWVVANEITDSVT